MNLSDYIETQLNEHAQKIVTRSQRSDEMALGELTFYMALRRVLSGQATMQDMGLMDAINDTLQQLGRVEKGETFYK